MTEAPNWVNDTAPTVNDSFIFNNTSAKNATADLGSVANLTISGYQGVISIPIALTVNQVANLQGTIEGPGSLYLSVTGNLTDNLALETVFIWSTTARFIGLAVTSPSKAIPSSIGIQCAKSQY